MGKHSLKLYDLTAAQKMLLLPLKVIIQKNIAQIPTYILINREIDWDLMQRAVEIEIQRNDCMRLRFTKDGRALKQYFLPEVQIGAIEFADFSGNTKEEMDAWLEEKAHRSLKYKKGETFEIIFFKAADGRNGIYFNAFHMIMDTFAILLFYNDLIKVYSALENGTEMPEPLDKYEESIQRDLAYEHSDRKEKDRAFYDEYFANSPKVTYNGIDGGRLLAKKRAKKRDPQYRAITGFSLYKTKTGFLTKHIDGETNGKWLRFCEENNVSYMALCHLGMHMAVSAVNDCSETQFMTFADSRRVKKADLNCGGTMVHGHGFITTISKDSSFLDAVKYVAKEQMKKMKHTNYSPLEAIDMVFKYQELGKTEDNHSISYSLLPPGSFYIPEGWDCEFSGMYTGNFMNALFHFMVPSLKDNGMDCYYQYYLHLFTEEEEERFHNLMVKSINTGIEQSQRSIGNVYGIITKMQ